MGITVFQSTSPLYTSPPVDVGTSSAIGSSLLAAPGDHTHKVADTGWLTPTLTNSWAVYDATWGNAAMYRKIGPIVLLRGLIKNGTLGASMFTLPAGYRPSINMLFACESNDVLCRMNVMPDGTITSGTGGSNLWISLDNIIFVADA